MILLDKMPYRASRKSCVSIARAQYNALRYWTVSELLNKELRIGIVAGVADYTASSGNIERQERINETRGEEFHDLRGTFSAQFLALRMRPGFIIPRLPRKRVREIAYFLFD